MKNFEIATLMNETIHQRHDEAAVLLRSINSGFGLNALIAVGMSKIDKKVSFHLSKPAYDFDDFCANLVRETEFNNDNKTHVYESFFGYLVTQSGCLEVSCDEPGVVIIAITENGSDYLKISVNRIELVRRTAINIDYASVWSKEMSDAEMAEFKHNVIHKFKFIQKFYDSLKNRDYHCD